MNIMTEPQPPIGDAPAEPRIIGHVLSTAGSQVVALLDNELADVEAVQMGGLVSIRTPHTMIYGIINSLATKMARRRDEGGVVRTAEIGLLGEIAHGASERGAGFRRGVSRLPPLDAPVSSVRREETTAVYALPGRPTVTVGNVHQDPDVPARLAINDLLSKHFAVLGTTGTGKSCGITVMLKRILEQNADAHVLILDPHGEYSQAFGDKSEVLTIDNFRLPYWLFNFDEFTEVLFGVRKPDMAAEAMVLREVLVAARMRSAHRNTDPRTITVDSPLPYIFSDLIGRLDAAMGKLDQQRNLQTYLRLKEALTTLRSDRRFEFMFETSLTVRDSLGELLGRLFRVPSDGKPVAIFDLGGIPSEVLNVVVGVVSRLAFDFAFWSRQRIPVLLVCDEAHRFAAQSATDQFALARRALTQIANEGRKYGIGLGIVSQRPSELAANVLSQCNTVFAFRTTNERDQEVLRAAMSDASGAIVASLPYLSNSEAIAIGEGVPVPMRLRFATLPDNERPRSSSAPFSERWNDGGLADESELGRVVTAFRSRRAE
ncbi:MAG: DUF87 domain-containing protein [Acetobacteraceae bacterium]